MVEHSQRVEVNGTSYVVQMVDAQTQFKILQKLARYGVDHLIAEMVRAEAAKDAAQAVKLAYIKTTAAIITRMPEEDQEFCLKQALAKTTKEGSTEPVFISEFTGRIGEYVLLGARAIGVQLGDFSCFRSLIPSSAAKAPEEESH